MDKQTIFPSHLVAHLADGLNEGLAFHVTNGASDLTDQYIQIALAANRKDVLLDLIDDVGNYLDRGSIELFTADATETLSSLDFLGEGPRTVEIESVAGPVGINVEVRPLKRG